MLRGPLQADRFRTTHYGGRYYVDPLEACDILPDVRHDKGDRLPAFSTIKKVHGGTFRKRYNGGTYDLDALRCALYVADQKEHLLRLDDNGIIEAVAAQPRIQLNKAGSRGTGVHSALEDLGNGKGFDRESFAIYHPESAEYADVIETFWAEQGPTIGYAEVVGLNWEHQYACTSDAMDVTFTSSGSKRLAIDFKSRGADSNHGCYETEAMQLAAAAGVEYIFVQNDDGLVVRQRPPELDLGIIVSIKPDGYELYPVDLVEAWEAWVDTCEAWRRMKSGAKSGRHSIGKPLFLQPTPITSESETAAILADPETMEALTEAEAELATVPSDVASPLIMAAFPGAVLIKADGTSDVFAGLPDSNGVVNEDLVKVTNWLRDRVVRLVELQAKITWPEHVPTFKETRGAGQVHTKTDLDLIEVAVKAAESEVMAPFPDQDPTRTNVPKDDPRVADLVTRVGSMTPDQVERYVAATAGIIGSKPTTGLCSEENFVLFQAAADAVVNEFVEVDDALIKRAIDHNSVAAAAFKHNEETGRWFIDHPQIIVNEVGGKRPLLKAGRELAEGWTPKNADEVLNSPALVAAILLAPKEAS